MTVARRALVTGRVQGVFYRATASSKARELAITGSACNLPDGRVEVIEESDLEVGALVPERFTTK